MNELLAERGDFNVMEGTKRRSYERRYTRNLTGGIRITTQVYRLESKVKKTFRNAFVPLLFQNKYYFRTARTYIVGKENSISIRQNVVSLRGTWRVIQGLGGAQGRIQGAVWTQRFLAKRECLAGSCEAEQRVFREWQTRRRQDATRRDATRRQAARSSFVSTADEARGSS